MTPLVPAVGGALVVAGVLGVALGAQRRPLSPPSPRRGPAVPRLRLSRRSRLLLAGGLFAVLKWQATALYARAVVELVLWQMGM